MRRSTTITDHTGRVTTRAYDPLNRVTVAVGTIADTTWFGYNDPLRTYTVTDANHQTYQAVENALGWTESRTDPRNAVERFAFDSNGNVISYTNRRNGTTTFSYDPLNRLQTATADNKTTTWSYDSLGMWIAVSNDESTDTLRNDTDDRLAEAVSVRAGVRFSLRPTYEQTGFPNGLTVERPGTWTRLLLFGHDSLFRFNYLRDFAGRGTSVAYNPDQLPNTITLPINVSGPTKLQQSVTYQASHQPYEVSFNSTNESLGRTYLYDALSRVTTASWGGASAGLSERRLEYDGAGRVSHYEDWHAVNQPVWTCPNPPSEDDCYWQDQWNWSLLRSDAYAYDKVGNPTDHGATVATGNRLAVFDGYTLTYDDDGNLIHKVKAGVVDQALT
ncbi:MAG: RHS repeat protein [Deltaproteobacteria bacterium]|nr:MAG: RHS repeat protein [Deltaproteobacteria bacterium]